MAFANERIKKQILRKVTLMLQRDLNDPRLGLITITEVELNRDRSECKVLWSSLEEGGARSAIAHALEDARGYVQREVASILATRTVPRLEFRFDPSVEGMERVSRLLREAQAEDQKSEEERRLREASDADESPEPPDR